MASSQGRRPRAVIFGLAGAALTADERTLFAAADPLGFILFQRNCAAPDQVRALVNDLRAVVGRADAPVLIDQEGGRVQRLKPPFWRAAPPAAAIAALAETCDTAAVTAAWLNARLIACDLESLGITVDCAPVVDLLYAGADAIIGDRAYGSEPGRVAMLARAVCAGLLAGGVLPVIKHIPGHGRARVDSHLALPVVETAADALRATDWAPFAALADQPWAMTAHVVYRAIDPERPATLSAKVIGEVVRGAIGFEGVLVSDDIGMGALSGSLAARAEAALAAGCDVVLHCSGDLAEMQAIVPVCPPIGADLAARLAAGEAMRTAARAGFDRVAAADRLAALLDRARA